MITLYNDTDIVAEAGDSLIVEEAGEADFKPKKKYFRVKWDKEKYCC